MAILVSYTVSLSFTNFPGSEIKVGKVLIFFILISVLPFMLLKQCAYNFTVLWEYVFSHYLPKHWNHAKMGGWNLDLIIS